MRFIERDVLLENWKKKLNLLIPDEDGLHPISLETVIKALGDAPTVDAVPVVRCKHCKHRGFDECPMYHEEWRDYYDSNGDYLETDLFFYDYTEDDGFCHKGEFEEDGD